MTSRYFYHPNIPTTVVSYTVNDSYSRNGSFSVASVTYKKANQSVSHRQECQETTLLDAQQILNQICQNELDSGLIEILSPRSIEAIHCGVFNFDSDYTQDVFLLAVKPNDDKGLIYNSLLAPAPEGIVLSINPSLSHENFKGSIKTHANSYCLAILAQTNEQGAKSFIASVSSYMQAWIEGFLPDKKHAPTIDLSESVLAWKLYDNSGLSKYLFILTSSYEQILTNHYKSADFLLPFPHTKCQFPFNAFPQSLEDEKKIDFMDEIYLYTADKNLINKQVNDVNKMWEAFNAVSLDNYTAVKSRNALSQEIGKISDLPELPKVRKI